MSNPSALCWRKGTGTLWRLGRRALWAKDSDGGGITTQLTPPWALCDSVPHGYSHKAERLRVTLGMAGGLGRRRNLSQACLGPLSLNSWEEQLGGFVGAGDPWEQGLHPGEFGKEWVRWLA